MQLAAESIIEVGRELSDQQSSMGRGNFLTWIEAEFSMSQSAAYRFMDVHKRLGDKLPTVGSLAPTALYALAAPSTPEPVRTEVVENKRCNFAFGRYPLENARLKIKLSANPLISNHPILDCPHSCAPRQPRRMVTEFTHHDDVAMPAKPILIHKLTPAQIDLIERLASSDGIVMDGLSYQDLVAFQELEKLGFAKMRVEPRKKIRIVITDQGRQVRAAAYISKKPVVRLTAPQVQALRFLAVRVRHFNDIPAEMKDVIRRLRLRGWATMEEDAEGRFWTALTTEGWALLKLLDY